MRRVAFASFIGTVVEFYDFTMYGIAAALVFPHIFFPALGPVAGTVASFATFGVAFVARPFGSVLFGHFGDRLGRKRTLIATLLLMGTATILVGLMPTASSIGVAAPVCIVVLRILQGLAAGGEWAGAVLFAAENAPKARRGFWAMFPGFGGGAATVLSNGTFFLVSLGVSAATFISWGWRIPFLSSILLVAIGLWVRLKIDETPVFKNEQSRGTAARLPFTEAARRQPREILLATGTAVAGLLLTYIGGPYLTNYGAEELQLGRSYVLGMAVAGGAALAVGVVLSGLWSDRLGRRRFLIGLSATAIVWSLILFPMLDTRSPAAFGIGVIMTTFLGGCGSGPLGALMSELFHTRYRYTAAGFCYSFGGVFGAAIPPLLAAPIITTFGSPGLGVFMAILCLISAMCVLALAETSQRDMDQGGADPAA